MAERYSHTLQENLITLLAYSDDAGRVVANMLSVDLMEGDYRTIAERCITYWRNYEKAPNDHTPDLFDDILTDKHNRRGTTIRRLLKGMVNLADNVNSKYVINQLRDFTRLQRFKAAVVESAEKINNVQHMALPEVEELWGKLLRTREIDFDSGRRLTDFNHVIAHLQEQGSEFSTGIKVFDRCNIRPARGKLLLLAAGAGRGKTWGLIHIAKTAMMTRKKILHITCEIDEEEVIGRYYQSIFSVSKRVEPIEVTEFQVGRDGRLEGLETSERKATFTMNSGATVMELQAHWSSLGRKGDNIIVKRFKPGEVTGTTLRAYLDTLEQTTGFVPDMIVFDYLGLMKTDPRDKKGSTGHNCIELRSIAIERNCAMVTAHQLNREGEQAQLGKGIHIADDWSIMGTADIVLIYSCTDMEFRHGLARMYVAKARSDQDRFAILISQAYKVGQFALDSVMLDRKYSELYKDFASADDYDNEDDDDAGDDDDD